jgi:hypothetical protein
MSLADDLSAIADMAAAMAAERDPDRAIAALALLAVIMPDTVERARLLVRRLVHRTFRQASRLAGSLPSDSGALMAGMADQRAWAFEGRPFRA